MLAVEIPIFACSISESESDDEEDEEEELLLEFSKGAVLLFSVTKVSIVSMLELDDDDEIEFLSGGKPIGGCSGIEWAFEWDDWEEDEDDEDEDDVLFLSESIFSRMCFGVSIRIECSESLLEEELLQLSSFLKVPKGSFIGGICGLFSLIPSSDDELLVDSAFFVGSSFAFAGGKGGGADGSFICLTSSSEEEDELLDSFLTGFSTGCLTTSTISESLLEEVDEMLSFFIGFEMIGSLTGGIDGSFI